LPPLVGAAGLRLRGATPPPAGAPPAGDAAVGADDRRLAGRARLAAGRGPSAARAGPGPRGGPGCPADAGRHPAGLGDRRAAHRAVAAAVPGLAWPASGRDAPPGAGRLGAGLPVLWADGEGAAAMSVLTLVGVDPGLVHTGVVVLRIDTTA